MAKPKSQMHWLVIYFAAGIAGAVLGVLGDVNDWKLDHAFYNTAAQVNASLAIALVFQDRFAPKAAGATGRVGFRSSVAAVGVLGIGGGMLGGAVNNESTIPLALTSTGVIAGVAALIVLTYMAGQNDTAA